MIALLFMLVTYSGYPTALSSWFESLHSLGGGYCCAKADGRETEYDQLGNHYRVPLGGKMVEVPDDRVLSQPNLYGRALVWLTPTGKIRCFIPGAQT